MSYPFVQAHDDYGLRKGPVQAFVVHMAEGGGTVGYLSRAQPRGVSVHYVIEYSGRIVQMLLESHASGSINPNDLRMTEGPAPYGAAVRRRVMGLWDQDPNAAVISLELEGFAAAGPNDDQRLALVRLVDDVRSRYPAMGLLGHRDFADYKACPGARIPWSTLGGHGPKGDDMTPLWTGYDDDPKIVTATANHPWYDLDGRTVLKTPSYPLTAQPSPYGVTAGTKKLRAIAATLDGVRRLVLIAPATITDPPTADCTAAIAADRLKARITYG